MRTYPDKLEIQPLDRPVNATVRVPGSKSITNRALVLAALASRDDTKVRVKGTLCSDDTEVMVTSLRALGFKIWLHDHGTAISIANPNADELIPACSADLFVGNSGTTMRFLAAFVSLGHGRYRLHGDARMHERPIGDLLDGLNQLGVHAVSEAGNGCPPIVIQSAGLSGGFVSIRGDTSSQFQSALLLAAPYAWRDTTLEVQGEVVSQPFVDMTVTMMREFGVGVTRPTPNSYRIPARQTYCKSLYSVEPDATAASYFFAAAAITGGSAAIRDLRRDVIQGDIALIDMLKQMGCLVGVLDKRNSFVHGRPLHGIDVDMNAISDTVMTLAAVACFAEGPTTIRNVAHIRHKETDRIAALATELRRVGAEVEEYPDGLKITPRPLHGAEIETYNDHRIAMSMALIGLKVPGIVIKNPGCVAKTYPGFWEDFNNLYK